MGASMAPEQVRTEGWGLRVAVVVLVAAAAGVFAARNAGAPFGTRGVVTETAYYCELFAQSWDEVGFADSLGIPMLGVYGRSVRERVPYLHHPVVGWWPPYLGRSLLGKREVGYRLLPLAFTLTGILTLAVLAGRRAGARWAPLLVVSFLACPLIQLYGAMPNMEPFTFACGAVLAVLWLRFRDRPSRRRLAALLGWFLVGTQVEWSFYLLAPGIWTAELLRPGGKSLLRPTLLLFPVGITGFVLALAHMALGTGDPGFVLHEIWSTVTATASKGLDGSSLTQASGGSFVQAQAAFLRENLGTGGLLVLPVTLVLLLGSRRWRRDPLTGVGVAFLVQAVLVVALFNAPAATHGYYWFPLAPAWALLLVQGVRAASELIAHRRPRGAWRWLPVPAALALVTWGALEVQPHKRALEGRDEGSVPVLETLGREVDRRFKPGTLLTTPVERWRGISLYSHRRWAPPLVEPRRVREILETRDRGAASFDHLVFLLDPGVPARFPAFTHWLQAEAARRNVTPARLTKQVIVYRF